jgi:hypothetical protein
MAVLRLTNRKKVGQINNNDQKTAIFFAGTLTNMNGVISHLPNRRIWQPLQTQRTENMHNSRHSA